MKFLSTAATCLALLAPIPASARAISFFDQSPIGALDTHVNGSNPFVYCPNSDLSKDIVQIHSVDLSPNPPQPGKTLNIKANGTLNEPVEDGATVLVTVKYGLITLIDQSIQLCDQLGNVNLHCPLQKGDLVLEKSVELPGVIPPGKYDVHAQVLTKDGREITCLEAHEIHF